MLSLVTMYVDFLREREGEADNVLPILTSDHLLSAGRLPRRFRHMQYVEHQIA